MSISQIASKVTRHLDNNITGRAVLVSMVLGTALVGVAAYFGTGSLVASAIAMAWPGTALFFGIITGLAVSRRDMQRPHD